MGRWCRHTHTSDSTAAPKRSRQLVFSCIAIVLGHKRRSLELSSPTILLLHQVVQSQTKNIPVGADCTREGTMVMRTQVTSRGERRRVAISKPATDLGSAEKRKERGRLKRSLVQAIKVDQCAFCEFKAKSRLLLVMHLRFDHNDLKDQLEE